MRSPFLGGLALGLGFEKCSQGLRNGISRITSFAPSQVADGCLPAAASLSDLHLAQSAFLEC